MARLRGNDDFVLTDEGLFSARIKGNRVAECDWLDPLITSSNHVTVSRQNLKQRNGHDRLLEYFRQRLDGRQPHPQSGERSWTSDYNECVDIRFQESVFLQQSSDLRDKLRGKCSAGERDLFDHFDLIWFGAYPRTHQPHETVFARGVSDEKKHSLMVYP